MEGAPLSNAHDWLLENLAETVSLLQLPSRDPAVIQEV